MSTTTQAFKRILLGRPLPSEEAHHQLLPKILALPVFASDALSSVSYATEEIVRVLILAGAGVLGRSIPIALAVSGLMVIVIMSYRQTVAAYPTGGGSYIVAHRNLGEMPGLIAAASILTDYVLTVAVSIAAGAFALGSLEPRLLPHLVGVSLVLLGLIAVANLRGARESGMLFAVPTYAFIISILAVVGIGVARCAGLGTCPRAVVPDPLPAGTASVGLFLVLRAFASGSTALTGVEAIADGVPAFRGRLPRDQARNAASTLAMLGAISVTMFVGITFLAHRMQAWPSDTRSILAQVARGVFGSGPGFALVQIATALILVLAANTSFQDFPRLSSILARDRFMPRQFINRGDRLVFSNGIIVLAGLAALLIFLYDADVSRLIQLYVVGVFTSFTLSQAGMVRFWRRDRRPGWKGRATLNAVGATVTGIVLVVVAVTKFMHGAWIVLIAVPILVLAFRTVNRHYRSVARQLRRPGDEPHPSIGTYAIVLAARDDEATLRALGYARAIRPLGVRAVHVGQDAAAEDLAARWGERTGGVPLDLIPAREGDLVAAVRTYIRALDRGPDEYVTVIVPEVIHPRGWRQFLTRRRAWILKTALLFEPQVVVTDVPTLVKGGVGGLERPVAPTRTIGLVLVSAVHNATLRAVAYARSLAATDLRALTFQVDPDETERIIAEWGEAGVPVPLEVLDSPYREVRRPLIKYVRKVREQYPDAIVSLVIPEFVVGKWWHQFLHNQTALAIKYALFFEPGVVITSVPFHLD